MNTAKVIITLLIAIIVSTLLYYAKMSKVNDAIDQMDHALSGSKTFIKPGSNIGFSGEPDKMELFAWARYSLAPAVIAENIDADTLLTIKFLADTTVPNRRVIWKNNDSLYHYSLTVK